MTSSDNDEKRPTSKTTTTSYRLQTIMILSKPQTKRRIKGETKNWKDAGNSLEINILLASYDRFQLMPLLCFILVKSVRVVVFFSQLCVLWPPVVFVVFIRLLFFCLHYFTRFCISEMLMLEELRNQQLYYIYWHCCGRYPIIFHVT